jgi:mechanosensitive ion channel-like protein
MALMAQINVREGVESAWESVITFVPKLVAFLLILLVGILIAKGVEKLLNAILERVGFDRLVERGGVKQALARSKFDASDILAKIVFYTLVLITLQLAFGVFGPNPISNLLQGLIAFLPKLFVALLIIVITAAIATGVKSIVENALGGLSYGRMLALVASVAIWVVGIAAALNQIEIAPEIVNGLFYALLALVVGVAIVAIGGGGIQPMRERWHQALTKMDQEAPRIKQQAQASGPQVRQQAEQIRQETQRERGVGAETTPPQTRPYPP